VTGAARVTLWRQVDSVVVDEAVQPVGPGHVVDDTDAFCGQRGGEVLTALGSVALVAGGLCCVLEHPRPLGSGDQGLDGLGVVGELGEDRSLGEVQVLVRLGGVLGQRGPGDRQCGVDPVALDLGPLGDLRGTDSEVCQTGDHADFLGKGQPSPVVVLRVLADDPLNGRPLVLGVGPDDHDGDGDGGLPGLDRGEGPAVSEMDPDRAVARADRDDGD